ncbi:MAG TPA: S9 family peptidase [Candidatus Dormibacteraeota bacterium]|nr:S9 family peptidase [Candidatus Dormibacteraeota bacterium]
MHVAENLTTVLYPASNPTKRPLTAEDLWKVARVGAPVPTPDGRVVVPVTTYDLEANKGKPRLWLVPGEGGEPRPLTSEEQASTDPAVSPDGRWVSFLRARGEEKPQLHLMPLDGGEAERLTDLPMGVLDPRWFPDGTKIAFVTMLLEAAPTPEGTKELLEKRAKDPVKVHVTEDRVYRYWDRWLTEGEKPHLLVLDLKTRALTDVTPQGTGWFDLMDPSGQYDVSPDGAEIAFAANSSRPPHHLLRWAIFTVPTSGKGPVTCLTPEGTPPKSADFWRPRYSPDGTSIFYGMQRDPYFYADKVRIVRYDRAARTHTVLTEDWDRSPAAWELAKDGTLILEAEDRGRVLLFSMTAGGGAPKALLTQGTASGLKIGRDGRVYFTIQTTSAPPEAASIGQDGKDLRKLTKFNDALLSEVALGEVREIEFPGADGNRVQMFVVLPPGFDPKKKWPLVHVIHGGPHGIAGDNFHFRWNPQAFAAPGYVVACVNFHGSTSWGQDFAAVIQGGHGDKPFTDIMRATDLLLETGFIDEKRMAATGGSYGGYLVCWIAGQTDRFACLVNHAGVFDLIAEYASDITQGRHQAYGGEPWDRLDALDRWNPARFARGFQSPMLVIHGERDYRVPHTQALAVYNIYKAKGVDARLVFFPDENHWVLKPRNSIVWNREVHGWLQRYLA